jgi:bifunctional polynucleotide phosphatase/kinase
MNYIIISNLDKKDYTVKKPLAMFDLDSTLIKTKSNKIFPIDENDWIFISEKIPTLLKNISKTHHVIIITNQLKLSKDIKYRNDWINKINNIIKLLSIKIEIYVSNKNDFYRKPSVGLFDLIKKNYNFEHKFSFYCGDAAGRIKDHSDCDLKFALNCGVKFILSEKFIKLINYDKNINISYVELPQKYIKMLKYNGNKKEMIIFVGFPASGKSTISKHIKIKNPDCNYKIINRDQLKTVDKCLRLTEEEIKKGNSVIIDNTNPSIESRSVFIKIAKKYKYKIVCIILETSKQLAQHNNSYRNYKYHVEKIPDIAYNVYIKKYNEPTTNEGIDKIIKMEPYKPKDLDYLKFYL